MACMAVVAIIATRRVTETDLVSAPRGGTVLLTTLAVAKSLEKEHIPSKVAGNAAQSFAILESLCGARTPDYNDQAYAWVKQNRKNWRDTFGAFANAAEVKKAVLADPTHLHLLIYMAPSWCIWSRRVRSTFCPSSLSCPNCAARRLLHLVMVKRGDGRAGGRSSLNYNNTLTSSERLERECTCLTVMIGTTPR